MKEVGKLKAPKAWSLCQLKETNLLDLGYVSSGPHEVVNAKSEEGVAFLAAGGVMPERPKYPQNEFDGSAFPRMGEPRPRRPGFREEVEEYKRLTKEWEHTHEILFFAKRVALDYLPIYEEELLFTGYGRGRSSVTMEFKAGDGQELSFGPSGIDGLIRAIQAEQVTIKNGRMKVRFTFAKKGSNVYAEVHYP